MKYCWCVNQILLVQIQFVCKRSVRDICADLDMCKDLLATQHSLMAAVSEAGPSARTTYLAGDVEKNGQSNGFNNLPQEVISRIFEFLPFSSLQACRLVCQQWYAASLAPALQDEEYLVCKKRFFRRIPATLKKSTRHFRQIYFKGAHFGVCSDEDSNYHHWAGWSQVYNEAFWTKFGPKVRSLRFKACIIPLEDLLKVLCHCHILKELRMEHCTFSLGNRSPEAAEEEFYEDMPALVNTEPLVYDTHIDSHHYEGRDDLFKQVLTSAPTLHHAIIDSCYWK